MGNFGFFLDTNYKIFRTAQEAQNVIDKQATEILQLKAGLELADRETRKENGRKQLLEEEFEEFKKNAAVVQREKEELEKEIVALKESVIKRKADWRSVELQINAENYGLKRALRHLEKLNQRMMEKNESLIFSTRSADEMVEKYETTRDDLQSTIVQLKTKLSSCQFQIDELKKDETFFRESSSKSELTATQLRKEIEDLRAEMKSQEETFSLKFSQVDRIRDENSLKSNFEKSTINQQNAKSELALKISQLETEAIQSRQAIELLQKENQKMQNTRETFVLSAQKAEKLALEQVSSLSDALAELGVAVKCSKSVAESENAESDLQNTGELKTDSKSTETRNASWLKKWLIKRGLSKEQKPEESELTKLLRSTGILMMKRAKDLKEQAKIVAVKGKLLTERAKQLSWK
jgi:chromosome segregation ATPase